MKRSELRQIIREEVKRLSEKKEDTHVVVTKTGIKKFVGTKAECEQYMRDEKRNDLKMYDWDTLFPWTKKKKG